MSGYGPDIQARDLGVFISSGQTSGTATGWIGWLATHTPSLPKLMLNALIFHQKESIRKPLNAHQSQPKGGKHASTS